MTQSAQFETLEDHETGTIHPVPSGDAPALPFRTPGPVLVVDDDALLRAVLLRVLTSRGYEALGACDARQARAVLAERDVDLVITDVVMPGESGVEVRLWLNAERPGLPVILISGFEDDGSVELALRLPHTAFVAKPFAPDGLLTLVRDTIGPASAA